MKTTYTEAPDPIKLTNHSKAFVLAAFDLIETITSDLTQDKSEIMMAVLAGGGRVGIEITADRNSENLISLVCVEPEGRRTVITTVATMPQPPKELAH